MQTHNTFNGIDVLGAPIDCGSSIRGCLMGPDAMRVADLVPKLASMGFDVTDMGNVTPCAGKVDVPHLEGVTHLAETAAWTRSIHHHVSAILARQRFPLVVGGDHAIALGSVSALAKHAHDLNRPLYVLWLDAHTDFNTFASSPTGNIHGMPVSYFCGLPGFAPILGRELKHVVDPKHVLMMGIRSVDDHERKLVNKYGVTVHDMRAMDEHGVVAPLRAFLDRVHNDNGMLHVSFDVDFLDPSVAPAVATTVQGGATLREAHLIMELVYESGLMTSLEVAELNPALDEAGKTAKLMVELVASGLGKRVIS